MVEYVNDHAKLPSEKKVIALEVFNNFAEKMNSRLEVFFYYTDMLLRIVDFLDKGDDFELVCSACFALAHCISEGEQILPIDEEEEKHRYIKYETFVIMKLKGHLRNQNILKYSSNLVRDVKSALEGIFLNKDGNEGIWLHKERYDDWKESFEKVK
jgi:hypothetical protein